MQNCKNISGDKAPFRLLNENSHKSKNHNNGKGGDRYQHQGNSLKHVFAKLRKQRERVRESVKITNVRSSVGW